MTVHVGTWMHDLDQARIIPPEQENVSLKVYSIDSHRLAYYLQTRERLAPLVREALLHEMGWGCRDNIRLSNLL